MNDNVKRNEPPELSDEDIEIVHAICKLATTPYDPPYKALFAAYDVSFAEQGIEQEHNDVVFHLLLRVGEAARTRGGAYRRVDLVGCLKEILVAQNITLVEHENSDSGDVTKTSDVGQGRVAGKRADSATDSRGNGVHSRKPKRRVSFDDARLDETWLNEHTEPFHAPTSGVVGQNGLMAKPPQRGRLTNPASLRRARSTSNQRHASARRPVKQTELSKPPLSAHTSELEHRPDAILLSQPSQTQLEMKAEAFTYMTTIRGARRCMNRWHSAALLLQGSREQSLIIAAALDRRTLLRQALDSWINKFREHQEKIRAEARQKRDEEVIEARQKQDEDAVGKVYNRRIKGIAFHHWLQSQREQTFKTDFAQRFSLQLKYFRRWRRIAAENVWKVRSILTKKWLAVWREKVARRQLREEQAAAVYEEGMVRRRWSAWFWHFCSRRVDGWHEERVKTRALDAVHARLRLSRDLSVQAMECHKGHLARMAVASLRLRLGQQQEQEDFADSHYKRKLLHKCLVLMSIAAKLAPLAQAMEIKVKLNLQRNAFRAWHFQLSLSCQAAEVDRKRVLQSAWTSWNDALRHQALAQRIDERVVVESLYKWVLAERSKLLERTVNARVARQAILQWRRKLHDGTSKLDTAEASFQQGQRRRALASSMVRIHLALRRREDAERAALEFANSRALPLAMHSLVDRHGEIQQLEHWAMDARFYSLCTRTIAVWRERTTQHAHDRRRDAYAQIRARVKIRVVGSCFAILRRRCANQQKLQVQAERRTQGHVSAITTQAFMHWRERTADMAGLEAQAEGLDRQKLLLAAFAAMKAKATWMTECTQRAASVREESNLRLLSSIVKRLQWEQFTAARRNESADALLLRNRDQHVRQMLRFWFAQTAHRREAKAAAMNEEPDSPSLRPASRAASRSRSTQRKSTSSPPAGTPAYMRTPARSRRGGRFRPLPTPAPVTPFAFDASYLATNPEPLPAPISEGEADQPRSPTLAAVPTSDADLGTLTPQVTPFARKLRAGGFASTPAPSILRNSIFGRSITQVGPGGTAKSVRFAGGSRFQRGPAHEKSS